ncbi:MAG: OsmC family protein [Myxococcota bacterium]|nr:OsmC family protein [Myxococcota bacterium]
MVEIEAQYEGGLHTRSVHGPSGAELQTDAPVDNQGRGEAFSPTDLVASALGACMLTVMGIVADRHGWTLAGTRIRVEKHMVTEPLRRIGRLVVELTWAPGIPDSARGPLIRAAETCPVRESLHPEIEVDLKVR